MPRMNESEARAFLAEPRRTAVFATVRPDRRPHAVPVWFMPDGEGYVFTTWHTTVKARNLRANDRVSLVVQDDTPPYDYAVIEGSAELIDDLDECRRIAGALGARYMGADRAQEFAARNGVPGELVVRIRPTAIHGFRAVAG
jgi:PPOX class probable F420-dependent enzyme